MIRFRTQFAALCTLLMLTAGMSAQSTIVVQQPEGGRLGWLTRDYRPSVVPQIRLTNSPRLESLIRAGNLYLSAQDIVALAIDNNIDVEIQR